VGNCSRQALIGLPGSLSCSVIASCNLPVTYHIAFIPQSASWTCLACFARLIPLPASLPLHNRTTRTLTAPPSSPTASFHPSSWVTVSPISSLSVGDSRSMPVVRKTRFELVGAPVAACVSSPGSPNQRADKEIAATGFGSCAASVFSVALF